MKQILNHWPQKLAALFVAALLWFFVNTDETTISQITLSVPLAVEGLESNQLTVGIPERVDVTVSGPSPRIDTLRPESIDAVLNLRGISDSFEQSIRVFPPQGLDLQEVRPSVIIGTIETKVNETVPVTIAPIGQTPTDVRLIAEPQTRNVTATGRAQQVDRVQQAVGVVQMGGDANTARLYPADETGQLVGNVSLSPSEVEVSFREQSILYTRRLPVDLTLPNLGTLQVAEQNLSQDTLRVAGPAEQLEALESVPATVEFATSTLISGRYTLDVRPRLPSGVIALDSLRVTLRLAERDE